MQVPLVPKHILRGYLDSPIGSGGSGSIAVGIRISSTHLRGSIITVILRVAARVLKVYDGEGICDNESSPAQNHRLDNVCMRQSLGICFTIARPRRQSKPGGRGSWNSGMRQARESLQPRRSSR